MPKLMSGIFVLSLALATSVAASALAAGTIERVSVASDGTQGYDYSVRFDCCAALSADGRFVAFLSQASNLVPGGVSGIDLYVRDR